MTTATTTDVRPAAFPHTRIVTDEEAAILDAEFNRRFAIWMAENPDASKGHAYQMHKAIWQGVHGAETITRQRAPATNSDQKSDVEGEKVLIVISDGGDSENHSASTILRNMRC
jgi:hypothetical protein